MSAELQAMDIYEQVFGDELPEVEQALAGEILSALNTLADGPSTLADVQPPSTVLECAARAAAAVIIAFERGYRMG